ncbi:MAG: quiB [Chthoniobacteraceae bacterium]|nr:quiB [Chthoniobacteraceae bacterium]
MLSRNLSSEFDQFNHVVGTIHSDGSLQRALRLRPNAVDFLEIRVDHFAADPRPLLRAVPKLKFPLILTARHPAEGGANSLNLARRRELMMEFLPFASVLDAELRTVEKLGSILAMARGHGIKILVSAHYFHSTPSASQLALLPARAKAVNADILKVAALTSTTTDLAALFSLFTQKPKLPLSVMGMGAFGKISRLLFARAGSVFNYGYLDKPNASGQWEATLLKARIAEIDAS